MEKNKFNYLRVLRLAYRAGEPQVSDAEYDTILDEYLNSPISEEQRKFLLDNYDNDPIDMELLKTYGLMSIAEALFQSGDFAKFSTLREANFSIVSIKEWEELEKWQSQFPKDTEYTVAIKRDGVRGNAVYTLRGQNEENGHFIMELDSVISRGGESTLIYHETTHCYLPKIIHLKQKIEEFTVAGEYTIDQENIQELEFIKGQKYTSSLSAAVSVARTGIPFNKDHLLKLSAYRIFGLNLRSKEDEFGLLKRFNIPTIEHEILHSRNNSFEELKRACLRMRQLAENSNIPTDGIVVSASPNKDFLARDKGKVNYNDMIALKLSNWVTNIYKAKILNFAFEMVGSQSNAKILIEPTKTKEGKTIREVNAFNPSFILNKLREGDTVEFTLNSNNNVNFVGRCD